MKLFSEYYAGDTNHDYHLFGKDDIDFLHQVENKSYYSYLIQYRYTTALPEALLKREEARMKPLKGFKGADGKVSKKSYYDTINEIAENIYRQLSFRGKNDLEKRRIRYTVWCNAKNQLDSSLTERPDKGGSWMIVNNNQNVTYVIGPSSKKYEVNISNDYIGDLVDRLEGPKGQSRIGYDLSRLQNYIPNEGGWRTDGFVCPLAENIKESFYAWVGFSGQGFLHNANELQNPESHRQTPKSQFKSLNKVPTETDLNDRLYFRPLRNVSSDALENAIGLLLSGDEEPSSYINYLKSLFQFNVGTKKNPEYAYRKTRAFHGKSRNEDSLEEQLKQLNKNSNLEKYDDAKIIKLLKKAGDSASFKRLLIELIVQTIIIGNKIQNYHGEEIDVFGGQSLRHPEEPLKTGKILCDLKPIMQKINNKIQELRAKHTQEYTQLADELENFVNNQLSAKAVGWHADVLNFKNPNQRTPLFLQFNNNAELRNFLANIPVHIDKLFDMRALIAGGGIDPNTNREEQKGPRLDRDIKTTMTFIDDYTDNDQIITNIMSGYYNGPNNIWMKLIIDQDGEIIDPELYELYKAAFRNRAFRNASLFSGIRTEDKMISAMKKIANPLHQRILDKDLGEDIGTSRKRKLAGTIANRENLIQVLNARIGKYELP